MNTDLNPYLTPNAPFVGRAALYEQLYQALIPSPPTGFLILGARGMGKTAALRQIHRLGEVIGVLLPLRELPLVSEREWLATLAAKTTQALQSHGYLLAYLPDIILPQTEIRRWFVEQYLAQLNRIVTQRIVYLLDDCEALLAAIEAGNLPNDTLGFLYYLTTTQPACGFVLTLEARKEVLHNTLMPLVSLTAVTRLGLLSPAESAEVLNPPERELLMPEGLDAVFAATGGHPLLTQRMGRALLERRAGRVLPPETVREVQAQVYRQSTTDFLRWWEESSAHERLMLTSIAQLRYADPLVGVTASAVQTWVAETHYAMDLVAIHAALRSLAYRDLIVAEAQTVHIQGDLWQAWLLENAGYAGALPATEQDLSLRQRWVWGAVALGGGAGLLLLLLWLLQPSSSATPTADSAALPTVTLVAPTATLAD